MDHKFKVPHKGLRATFEIRNEDVVDSTFEKEFKDRTEMYEYMRDQSGHPWLSLHVTNVVELT